MGANVRGDVDREPTAALELRFVPGAMPEMQNFNCSAVLVQPVVDVERRVEKPSELRMFFYGSADVRKGLKQFDARSLANCSVVSGCFPLDHSKISSRSANAFSR